MSDDQAVAAPPCQAVVAVVRGEEWTSTPTDLYIPPDALKVFLETFEGPLDLLLYLIRKQNIDILSIPIAEITRQYMAFVALMQTFQIALAAEYLVMAALLAEIKSRLLLPRPPKQEEEEEADPRMALVRRLQTYAQYRDAAMALEALPRVGRDIFVARVEIDEYISWVPVGVTQKALVEAFLSVRRRSELLATHRVTKEHLSIRENMARILQLIQAHPLIAFDRCLRKEDARLGIVVAFLSVLELLKIGAIEISQSHAFASIYLSIKEPS